MNQRPKNSPAEVVFRSLLATIRTTLDPNAVAAHIKELAAEYGAVVVNAALDAVELRLDEERRTFEAVRAIPAIPPTADEQHGHA